MLIGGERSLPEIREMHKRITPEKYEGNIPFERLGINKILIIYYQHRHGYEVVGFLPLTSKVAQ